MSERSEGDLMLDLLRELNNADSGITAKGSGRGSDVVRRFRLLKALEVRGLVRVENNGPQGGKRWHRERYFTTSVKRELSANASAMMLESQRESERAKIDAFDWESLE